jgi:hypothetical protein
MKINEYGPVRKEYPTSTRFFVSTIPYYNENVYKTLSCHTNCSPQGTVGSLNWYVHEKKHWVMTKTFGYWMLSMHKAMTPWSEMDLKHREGKGRERRGRTACFQLCTSKLNVARKWCKNFSVFANFLILHTTTSYSDSLIYRQVTCYSVSSISSPCGKNVHVINYRQRCKIYTTFYKTVINDTPSKQRQTILKLYIPLCIII